MFSQVIHQILNQRVLMINKIPHRICEIEIYCCTPNHRDPYAHCHPDQATYGNLGFHRASNKEGSKYKNGNYKGLDLTLGSENNYMEY